MQTEEKNMKYKIILITFLAAATLAACTKEGVVEFGTNRREISVGAIGGKEIVRVAADDEWIASTDKPWITVSPANGRGSTPCTFIIDSALTAEPRSGVVRIQNVATKKYTDISVAQEGFPYAIKVEEPEIEIANYEEYGERWFEVKVSSNVDFSVEIPVNSSWLKCEKYELNLNRGVRPREVTLRFNWDINTSPRERLAEVAFKPKKSDIELSQQDKLNIRQDAAEPIVPYFHAQISNRDNLVGYIV